VAFCDAGYEEFSDTVMITKFMLEYVDEALQATLVLEEPYFYSGDGLMHLESEWDSQNEREFINWN
jgi:hypothetical protein